MIDLLKKLLCRKDDRLGSTNGADEIKAHPFFKDVDWENLRQTPPPIVPEIESVVDTSNFPELEVLFGRLCWYSRCRRLLTNHRSFSAVRPGLLETSCHLSASRTIVVVSSSLSSQAHLTGVLSHSLARPWHKLRYAPGVNLAWQLTPH